MASDLYGFSAEDLRVLQDMISRYNRESESRPHGLDPMGIGMPLSSAPEVYVATTPVGGIPAMSGSTLGSAECNIYQKMSDNTLAQVSGLKRVVYNFTTVAVPGSTAIVVKRDKWGTWFPDSLPSSGGGAALLYQEFTTPGSHTFTNPFTTAQAFVEVVSAGGGGGSGRRHSTGLIGGGGGGSGGVCLREFLPDVIGGGTVTVNVGTGGAGGATAAANTDGSDGADGTDTYFSTFLLARGGKGGKKGTSVAAAQGGRTTIYGNDYAGRGYTAWGGDGGGNGVNGDAGHGRIANFGPGGGGGGGSITSGAANGLGGVGGVNFPNILQYGAPNSTLYETDPLGDLDAVNGRGSDAVRVADAAFPGNDGLSPGQGGGGGCGAFGGTASNAGGKGGDGRIRLWLWKIS